MTKDIRDEIGTWTEGDWDSTVQRRVLKRIFGGVNTEDDGISAITETPRSKRITVTFEGEGTRALIIR
jgi:hypothetical protein